MIKLDNGLGEVALRWWTYRLRLLRFDGFRLLSGDELG